MNLYEITGNVLKLQEMLESGEIDEQTYSDTLEGLDPEYKIENMIYVIKNLEAKAEACKKAKDDFAAKQKTAENGIERLKNSILNYMSMTDKKKVEAGLYTINRSASKKVEVVDTDKIDAKYLIQQPAKIDKTKIAEDIKSGIEVSGAVMTASEHIRIK